MKIFFLVFCLAYLVLAYSLRWYEYSNRPQYWLEYGNRRIFKAARGGIKYFIIEYFYVVINLILLIADYLLIPVYYIRGERDGIIRDHNTAPLSGNPIILLHGYVMRGSVLWLLRYRLRRDKRRVWNLNYGPQLGSITDFAQQLEYAVDKILAETGSKKADLIGHSMGGLVILYYLAKLGGKEKIERAITLGTPFWGTKLWAFSIGTCGVQMRYNTPYLAEIREESVFREVKFTSIYSDYDELILPHESAYLDFPKVNNKIVNNVGHVGFLYSQRVYQLIEEGLEN